MTDRRCFLCALLALPAVLRKKRKLPPPQLAISAIDGAAGPWVIAEGQEEEFLTSRDSYERRRAAYERKRKAWANHYGVEA